MSQLKFNAVTTLPGTLEADSFYFVQNGTYAESYLTNAAGVARSVGNSAMINTLINAALAGYEGGGNTLEIVADITARDALTLTASALVLVVDASADATVTAGAAMYAWNQATTAWIKVTEYESMDVVVAWESITGRPSSTPAQIDSAVAASHSHSNKTVLDGLSDVGGLLRYGGNPIQGEWVTKNW